MPTRWFIQVLISRSSQQSKKADCRSHWPVVIRMSRTRLVWSIWLSCHWNYCGSELYSIFCLMSPLSFCVIKGLWWLATPPPIQSPFNFGLKHCFSTCVFRTWQGAIAGKQMERSHYLINLCELQAYVARPTQIWLCNRGWCIIPLVANK